VSFTLSVTFTLPMPAKAAGGGKAAPLRKSNPRAMTMCVCRWSLPSL
jgi:hypothetical protein